MDFDDLPRKHILRDYNKLREKEKHVPEFKEYSKQQTTVPLRGISHDKLKTYNMKQPDRNLKNTDSRDT